MSSKRALDFDSSSAQTPATRKKTKVINSASAASTSAGAEQKSITDYAMDEESGPLSPSKVTHPATKVDFCAMLTSLSPMKKKHFLGELIDEHKSIGLVGFDPAQKKQLDALNLKQAPVLLKNCDIQSNKYSKSLEVVIKGYTQIVESTTKFDIDDPSTIGTHSIKLNKLPTMKEYNKVNVQVKIIDISTPQLVGAGKTKQEVTIADPSGTATLTLWEDDINSLTLSHCYSMKRLLVRVFHDNYSLSLPATGAVITPTDDIPDVSETLNSTEPTMENAEVMWS